MKIKIRRLYLWLITFSSAITYGFNFFHSPDTMYNGTFVQRQYGNAFTINIFTLLLPIGFLVIIILNKRIKFSKDIFIACIIFLIFTFFFPNNQNREFTCFAIYALGKYLLLFIILISIYEIDEFKKDILGVFKAILVFETILGILQVFFSIKIPYISTWSTDSIRNGLVRMAGTFSSGPDFSLVIAFLMSFFLVECLYNSEKGLRKYIIICVFDIWFAGSRTMIVIIAIITFYILLKKYKNQIFFKILLSIMSITTIWAVSFTTFYQNMFVNNNIKDMFMTRLVHWMAAIHIIKDNWLFGVGLNNSVTYIQNHPQIISNIYKNSLENIGFYYTNPIHNSILLVFCECGIIGGILYLGIYIKMILECRKFFIIYDVRKRKNNYLFIICATIIWFVYALQGWGTLKEHSWILFTLLYTYFILLKKSNNQLIN